jgi:hypothetical protein
VKSVELQWKPVNTSRGIRILALPAMISNKSDEDIEIYFSQVSTSQNGCTTLVARHSQFRSYSSFRHAINYDVTLPAHRDRDIFTIHSKSRRSSKSGDIVRAAVVDSWF